jgi:hypothetical protein
VTSGACALTPCRWPRKSVIAWVHVGAQLMASSVSPSVSTLCPEGKHPGDCSPVRPGRGSKPHSVSGSIRLRAFLDGREAFFLPSPRACSWGVGRFTISRRILRRGVFTVPSGCVVSAPWLALSPGGFPPTPMASGVGTFLSGRLLPTRTTVSCPPPPGGRPTTGRLDNDSVASRWVLPGLGETT